MFPRPLFSTHFSCTRFFPVLAVPTLRPLSLGAGVAALLLSEGVALLAQASSLSVATSVGACSLLPLWLFLRIFLFSISGSPGIRVGLELVSATKENYCKMHQ